MHADNAILIRGGGDLATGVALRLHRSGFRVVVAELAQPLAVRRAVAFAEAVYEGTQTVEGVKSTLVDVNQLPSWNEADCIPVIVDPEADVLRLLQLPVAVDARLLKHPPLPLPAPVRLHVGLGPGFTAGMDCDAVVETRRSHRLGRVYWTGTTEPDSGEPEGDPRRVLRAPTDGLVMGLKRIGSHCDEGEIVAKIGGAVEVASPLSGVLRGLIRDSIRVRRGMKIGDIDERNDTDACFLVSDKALAVGGGVLEAILSRGDIR